MSRAEDLAAALDGLRRRMALACHAAGRDPADVTLVAVSKTFPASDIRLLAGLGITDVGENRDQEARLKAADLADLVLRWHFLGRVQRNKATSLARYADVVHSLDRPEVVEALDAAATRLGRRMIGLVQVSLDGDIARGGVAAAGVAGLADRIAQSKALTLGGVMAVAPLESDPAAAFGRLAEVAATVREAHPEAGTISAGMTGDLESAIAHGSTCVRVGAGLLGARPPR